MKTVAVIVDVMREARGRFTAWAEGYVGIPPQYLKDGVVRGDRADEIIRFFVENKILTKREIEIIAKRRGFLGVVAFRRV